MSVVRIKVFVYFNITKKLFSVKDLKTGLVIRHLGKLTLSDVEFKVSEAGRKRVLKERRKNVHAGLRGYLSEQTLLTEFVELVTYNPYRDSSFVVKGTDREVTCSDFAELSIIEGKPVIKIKRG